MCSTSELRARVDRRSSQWRTKLSASTHTKSASSPRATCRSRASSRWVSFALCGSSAVMPSSSEWSAPLISASGISSSSRSRL
jgi:hypothetical protein